MFLLTVYYPNPALFNLSGQGLVIVLLENSLFFNYLTGQTPFTQSGSSALVISVVVSVFSNSLSNSGL